MKNFLRFGLIALAAFTQTFNVTAQSGVIRGILYDNTNGETLPFATIYVKEAQKGANSDLDGAYNFALNPGTYTLEFSFVGYSNQVIQNVLVKANEVTELDVRLSDDAKMLQEVVVKANIVKNSESALLTMQKKSPNMMDGISKQAFRKIGDSDAGGAIKRVTGVSVEGGKYVYVRGLGDRYTKTILNGLDVPGLDPDRNALQMDLFPTNIIDNIIVLKTATPDVSGDFTGGIVDISTKDFPVEKTFNISVGGGYNPSMHFNSNYVYGAKSPTDILGFDNGQRSLPFSSFTNIPSISSQQNAQLTNLTKSFSSDLGVIKGTSPMDYNFAVSTGNQKNLSKMDIGYNLALNYRNSTEFFKEAVYNAYIKSNTISSYDFELNQSQVGPLSKNNVLLSGLAGFSVKYKRNKVGINLLRIQNGESTAGKFIQETYILNSNTIYQDNVEYAQRSITNANLKGEHVLDKNGNLRIDWSLSPTLSNIQDKDVRVTPFRFDQGNYSIEPSEGAQPRRLYRNLDERNLSGRLDVTKKFVTNYGDSKLKFGVSAVNKNRDYEIFQYVFNIKGQSQFDINGDPNKVLAPGNIWTPEKNAGVYVVGNYEPANTYAAKQTILAAYVMNEYNLSSKLKAIYGLRVEKFDHYYTGQNNLGTEVLNNEKINKALDLLPSANIVYNLTENTNLRMAVSRTLARPSFKEASISQIYDALSDRTFIGNKDLKETKIMNFDLRLEKFMDNGQMVSVSGFYKQFKNPIEIVSYSQLSPNDFTPRNVGSATVAGGELELRKNVGLNIGGEKPLSLGTNLTLVYSNVMMNPNEFLSRIENAREGEEVKESRRLQGQSPFIINAYLGYDHKKSGLEGNLSYNVQGKRLSIVGIGRNPDVYEMPFNSLNLKVSKRLGAAQKSVVSFGANNLLDAKKQRFYEGYNATPVVYDLFRPGTSYSFSLAFGL